PRVVERAHPALAQRLPQPHVPLFLRLLGLELLPFQFDGLLIEEKRQYRTVRVVALLILPVTEADTHVLQWLAISRAGYGDVDVARPQPVRDRLERRRNARRPQLHAFRNVPGMKNRVDDLASHGFEPLSRRADEDAQFERVVAIDLHCGLLAQGQDADRR